MQLEKLETLEKQFLDVISVETEKSKTDKFSNDLLKANDFYNKLVNDGTIKKRGYTLAGIDPMERFNVVLNSI